MRSVRYFVSVALAMLAVLVVAAAANGQTDSTRVQVYYNDELLPLQNAPLLDNGVSLVEFRPIFERLGFMIFWNEKNKTITGNKPGLHIELTIGSPVALVNGEPVQLAAAPRTVNGRTLVPLRFIGESAGCYVRWEEGNAAIRLYRIAPERAATDTNFVYMIGKVPEDVRWVRFQTVKEGVGYSYEYVRPDNGRVEYNLYLSDGAGTYSVEMAYSQINLQDTQLYHAFAATNVYNSGNSGLHLDNSRTDNSKLTMYGELPDAVQTVAALVVHNESALSKWVIAETDNGLVSQPVYLSFGPGAYTVHLYTTEEELDTANEFYLLKTVTAVNDDPRAHLLTPSEMVESDHPDIVALAQTITAGFVSDSTKSKAIHDWVASNIRYDTAVLVPGGDRIDSALETLQGKLTDCDGYARLNAALHRAAGIQAKIVLGVLIDTGNGETWANTEADTVNHAWNEVLLDGRWVVQDPTLNAGYVNEANQYVPYLSHSYYDPSPERFALDHKPIELEYVYE